MTKKCGFCLKKEAFLNIMDGRASLRICLDCIKKAISNLL